MAAGDHPFNVSGGRVTWQLESTFGAAPASGAWNTFGPRVSDFRDPGPITTWNLHRTWNSGREAAFMDRMSVDYGPASLGTFKLQDVRFPGFAFGEEVDAPAALGGGYYRHTATFTTNSSFDGLAMSVQVHDGDSAGNATRTTYVGGVISELALSCDEAGEITYEPTMLFQKEDDTVALNTVSEPTTSTLKHHHGYIEIFGQQLLRVVSWNARVVNNPRPRRYYNDTNPRYAYEYPFTDPGVILSVVAVADGRQFSGFSSRDITKLAANGDIGSATLRAARTVNQDEGKLVIGSSNDALGIISAPRVRPAAGGQVQYELDFACRTANWQWVDQSSARYFPS